MKKLFTSESVTEGHPDKMCDHCENVYYVYGCEQDCKYSRVCLRRDRFPFWRPQKDEE